MTKERHLPGDMLREMVNESDELVSVAEHREDGLANFNIALPGN